MAVVAAFAVSAVSIADAAPRKRQVVYAQQRQVVYARPGPGSTVVTSQDERGRVRTKILVQKRSYLDGGTEVMPGDIQSHQTNFIDMHQNPRSAVSNDNIVPGRPINDPFFLPGKNNPYFR
jgi:esterase/lipase superfamily enzyme